MTDQPQLPKDSPDEHRRKWALQFALQSANPSVANAVTLIANAVRIERFLKEGEQNAEEN